MNYLAYYPVDMVNGTGTRCTLFVSGCEHKCKGCYNSTSWDASQGRPFTIEDEDRIISDLNDSEIVLDGLSLSGGDPLFHDNLNDVLSLVKRVRSECSGKTIWIWTGYEIEGLSNLQWEIVKLVDVIITGKFIKELHNPSLLWKGSSNQKVIDVKSYLIATGE